MKIVDYLKWLKDPSSGLTRTITIESMKTTVTFLPAEYRAYQEIKDSPDRSLYRMDSLVRIYRQSISFLVSFESLDRDVGDVLLADVEGRQELNRRLYSANFSMDHCFALRMGARTYTPVLVSLDNDYGMGDSRRFIVTFVDEHDPGALKKQEPLLLIYTDDLFNTGSNQFLFPVVQLDELPKISID